MRKRTFALLLVVVACSAFFWTLRTGLPEPLFPFDQVVGAHRNSDAVLLDRHGQPLQELRLDMRSRRLDWTPLERISPALRKAVVFAEDRRFDSHGGVDWRALVLAGVEGIAGRGLRGASTITMQLASMLNPALDPAQPRSGGRRTWREKWRQIGRARRLERLWTKDQILEAYLNLISFRGELQGIAAASVGLFGKQPHGLTEDESVILAVLLRSPNASLQTVTGRAARLRQSMGLEEGEDLGDTVQRALLHPPRIPPAVALAPQLARRLLQGRGEPGDALTVRSTLDLGLQEFATAALRYRLRELAAQNVRDGALIVVDNASGDVLAYVANTGVESSARHVDGIVAQRQAGSVLKPFLYALALDRGLMTAASLLDDSALDLPVTGGLYRPGNYDNQFSGIVTARIALASSLNVPAVKTLMLVGVESFLQRLKSLGFQGLRSADFYGPSLALGSADITVWDLANAYRTLANGGRWSSLRLRMDEKGGASSRLFSSEAAFVVSDILADRESRSRTFSLESPLAPGFWAAVKTGTSKDMRDNWCVGYSSRYTTAVWVGNFSGAPMWNVSGMSGSAPAWLDIMKRLHDDDPGAAPSAPPGVVARTIAWGGATREEWFLAGTEPDAALTAQDPGLSSSSDAALTAPVGSTHRIRYPAAGSVFALDPDIPPGDQRLFFESAPHDGRFAWLLDGRPAGAAGSLQAWEPSGGSHELLLLDEQRQVVDRITFEVRGGEPEAQ